MASRSDGSNEQERTDSSDEPPQKRPATCETLDRLSALPEAILLHILSLLPMHEVVRTSSLSKNWQYLWTTVPNLLFTDHKSVPNLAFKNHKSRDCFSDFVRFVDQTLIQCRHSKVYKFSLSFECKSGSATHYIDQWIRFATRCDVEHLSIDLSRSGGFTIYNLPEHIFSCSSITELKLSCCNVVPNGTITWNSLKKLCLEASDVNEDTLQNIIVSGSPLLEVLELDHCRVFNPIDINSTTINVYLCSSSEHIISDLEHAICYRCSSSSLTKLILRRRSDIPMGVITWNWLKNLCLEGLYMRDDTLRYILWGSPLLEVLELDCCRGFKYLDIDSTRLRKLIIQVCPYYSDEDVLLSEISAPNLQSLAITGYCGGRTIRLVNMLSLVDAYLNFDCTALCFEELLQSLIQVKELTLELDCLWFFRSGMAGYCDLEKYWTSRESILFPCLQQNLKIFKCVGSNRREIEHLFPFLKFLLKNALVLQKMVISMRNVGGGEHSCCESKELLKVARKLLSCPRSSQKAVVMFTE